MSYAWIREEPARWDEDKRRILGGAPAGIFDRRFAECAAGEFLPSEWWRVEDRGRTVGYGWLDLVWGDAEITLAVDPEARGSGVGSFILGRLEAEAHARGVRYVYNTVRPSHPDRKAVSAWLEKRGFHASDDGSLYRAPTRSDS